MKTIAATAITLVALALTSPVARADDPMCAAKYWYQVCRFPDGSWAVCGLNGPGCQPMINAGPSPLPGSTPAPGIGG